MDIPQTGAVCLVTVSCLRLCQMVVRTPFRPLLRTTDGIQRHLAPAVRRAGRVALQERGAVHVVNVYSSVACLLSAAVEMLHLCAA